MNTLNKVTKKKIQHKKKSNKLQHKKLRFKSNKLQHKLLQKKHFWSSLRKDEHLFLKSYYKVVINYITPLLKKNRFIPFYYSFFKRK